MCCLRNLTRHTREHASRRALKKIIIEGEGLLKKKQLGRLLKESSVKFKAGQSDFYWWRRLVLAWGFLLVRGVTLEVSHCPWRHKAFSVVFLMTKLCTGFSSAHFSSIRMLIGPVIFWLAENNSDWSFARWIFEKSSTSHLSDSAALQDQRDSRVRKTKA